MKQPNNDDKAGRYGTIVLGVFSALLIAIGALGLFANAFPTHPISVVFLAFLDFIAEGSPLKISN